MATVCASRIGNVCRLLSMRRELWLRVPSIAVSTGSTCYRGTTADDKPRNLEDETRSSVTLRGIECHSPKEAKTNLLNFLNQSDVQKRKSRMNIPFFTAGSYLAVTRSDPCSPSGTTKFVGICIARRNKGPGSTFILRNVIDGMAVEMMFELYSPMIKEIQVLKLERRRRAKLYYLREKPLKYSTVNEKMPPVKSDKMSVHRRRGAPA